MAGNDDLIARLLSKKYTREAWDEPHGTYDQPCDADDYGAEESFVNPAGPDAAREIERLRTALAERDATIERLTRERDAEAATALSNLEAMLSAEDRATTVERERDEARAEVERLRAGLEHVCAQATGFGNATVRRMANIARAALHPEGAEDGQS